MAKLLYKIPASINRSRLDHEITISGFDISLKPLPVKVILYWIGWAFICLWLVAKSPVSEAPIWMLALLIIWFFALAAWMGGRSKTGEMKFMQVPALISYVPKANRSVMTRRHSDPYGFMSIVGIKEIEPGGTIHYLDGSVGHAYSVVGSASLLLFDQDRAAIVNRVDSFWRKVDTDAEWNFIAMKQPQRVFRQVANVERQNTALKFENRHPEIRELLEEKYEILRDDVGGKFNSIHQYLLITAKSMEHLENAHSVLAAEVEGSTMMIKQCTSLDDKATLQMLKSIYKGESQEIE